MTPPAKRFDKLRVPRLWASYAWPEWNLPMRRMTIAKLLPGTEIKYTNFTIGGSYEGTAIAYWDHGKSVEARTLGGEKIRLERAEDGSLRRFT